MNLHTAVTTHLLPLWFLVLSLFLPRLCIALAFVQHSLGSYIPTSVGLIPIIVWLLIPRILILFWIYQDQGISMWFLIHAIALLLAWGSGGHRVTRRRTRVVEVTD